jgi:hypothetical protein
MNPMKEVTVLIAILTVSALTAQAQTPMKGVMRDGNTLIITGTVIEATKDFVRVDAGFSTYKFPLQEKTKLLDAKGRRISADQFREGQGVTVRVVDGDKVLEIRRGELKMELQPLKSMADLPGMVTLGKGEEAVTVWAAEHTIKVTDKAPGPGWERLDVGLKKSQVKDLLGEPGREQEVGNWLIWWYRYTNGMIRCVGFQEEKVVDWKNVPSAD